MAWVPGLALVFVSGGGSLTSIFQKSSASAKGVFILSGRLGSYVVQQLVKQLVYIMFISNNCPLFHLW